MTVVVNTIKKNGDKPKSETKDEKKSEKKSK